MNLQWKIANKFQMLYYCLYCNAQPNNLSDLTGPRSAMYMYIDINMDIFYLSSDRFYGAIG